MVLKPHVMCSRPEHLIETMDCHGNDLMMFMYSRWRRGISVMRLILLSHSYGGILPDVEAWHALIRFEQYVLRKCKDWIRNYKCKLHSTPKKIIEQMEKFQDILRPSPTHLLQTPEAQHKQLNSFGTPTPANCKLCTNYPHQPFQDNIRKRKWKVLSHVRVLCHDYGQVLSYRLSRSRRYPNNACKQKSQVYGGKFNKKKMNYEWHGINLGLNHAILQSFPKKQLLVEAPHPPS